MPIEIHGKCFNGLLDSGANRSFIGRRGWAKLADMSFMGAAEWEKLRNDGVTLSQSTIRSVRVANGENCPVIGSVIVPVLVGDVKKMVNFLVVPALPHELILGMDFWRAFGLVVDAPKERAGVGAGVLDEVVVSRDGLSEQQRVALERLVERFRASLGRPGLGCTHLVTHRIDTGDATPVRQRCYSYSPRLIEVLHTGLEDWLKKGVVEPSSSPWASPVLLIKKGDGSYRWVVDLRTVNRLSKGDSYPLPKVTDILDQLREARYISSVDMSNAYFQIPLEEDSREKTAFIIPGKGLFQFTRMPQGLHTSAATWQRFIDRVLGEDLKPYVFVYLDDIIMISKDFDNHLALLEKVLSRLEGAGLTINFEKSKFCRDELKYLGYVVNRDGLQVDPEKVEAIVKLTPPQSVTALKRFIGMASWYRRFVQNFASIMSPLHALTKKGVKYEWSEECQAAFDSIKLKLTTAPVLACPDFSKRFDLFCDASGEGLGCVLGQEGRVIAYASRSLTKAERKYFPTELECLAVLWAVEKHRCYLEGYFFHVITDHASLLWLDNLKDPVGRLGRWAVRLQQYDYKVIHRKGKEHQAPDALSRAALPYSGETVDLITVENPVDPWYVKMLKEVEADPDKYHLWKAQGAQLYKLVKNGKRPFQYNRVLPLEARGGALQECHDSELAAHLGVNKTLFRLREYYYWPAMSRDVRQYVRACDTCAKYKVPQVKPAGLMGQKRQVDAPLQVVACDLMEFPRSSSGHKYLAVTIDLFSKMVWMRPLRKAEARTVIAHLLEDVFLKFGVPGVLLCDNGPQYKSDEMKKFCEEYGVKILYNYAYHAQANPTERANRVIKTMIASYVKENHRHWDRHLHKFANAINTAKHDVTGYTPHEIVFGSNWKNNGLYKAVEVEGVVPEVVKPDSLPKTFQKYREEIVKRLDKAYERNKVYYNFRRRPVDFKVGDTVYRVNHVQSNALKYFSKKLAPKYVGPYTVVRKVGYQGYLLEDKNGKRDGPWHIKHLKE
ncbi:Transposon Ty3-I Gag-Pol polyprotein, partial [Frankliniella fusca]